MRRRFEMITARRFNLRNLGAILVVLALAGLANMPAIESLFSSFDRVHFDATAYLFAKRGGHDVVVVQKGEKSIRALGRNLVFSSDANAALIDRLDQARSVVFDIPFPTVEPGDEALIQAIKQNRHVIAALPSTRLDAHGDLLLPLPDAIYHIVAGVGQRNMTIGHYGTVTGFVPYATLAGTLYQHVALEAIRVAHKTLPISDLRDYEYAQVTSIGRSAMQSVLLMLPPLPPENIYSFADVLTGKVPASAFKDKIVFFGHSIYQMLGEYSISSLNNDVVSGVQLDAMIAAALLNGNVVREMPPSIASLVNPVFALGILCLCAMARPRRLHLYAFGWGIGILALSTLLLGVFHFWVPVGSTLAVCLLIYGYFAWSQLNSMHRLLRREIETLRRLSSSVGVDATMDDKAHEANPSPIDSTGYALHEMRLAIRQIREWQEAYVTIINLLPYPVFLERDGRFALWNQRAGALFGGDDAPAGRRDELLDAIRTFASQHTVTQAHGEEIHLLDREYMLLAMPFAQLSASSEGTQARLICLIDVEDVKKSVRHDRQTLRHIAHDLRNPLTTILALIEEQRTAKSQRAGERDERFMADLRKQVDYSLRLSQDFMQLSRAEALDPATFVPLAIVDVLDAAVDQMLAAAQRSGIALILDTSTLDPDAPALVNGNHDMLLRALVNVLDNAIKYSPAQTTIRATAVRQTHDDHAWIGMHVIDQGPGIPADALPHLFEPFFRVKRDGRRSEADVPGTGLGLPFVKTVVERHGGRVDVSSAGRGTDVSITLPLVASPHPHEREEDRQPGKVGDPADSPSWKR